MMTKMNMMMFPVFVAVLALVLTTPLSGYASGSSTSSSGNQTLTPDQKAAGGPLPGNFSQVQGEQKCVIAEHGKSTNVPWYPTLVSTEHAGSERTGLFACAQFGGSYTKPNQVYAYESPTSIGAAPSYLMTRDPNELYFYSGGFTILPGPFVSKMEAGSLREQWHTPLSNNNVTGNWLIPGAANFPADGTIAAAQGQYLYKVNASTGAVKKVVSLPTGKSPPSDSNFAGMGAFADGILVLKTQNRVAGCTNQGYTFGSCANQSKVAPSVIVAVDPKTFNVLDWKQLPQMIGGRIPVTQFQGKDYTYLAGSSQMYRYEWNGKNITLDTSWGPVSYLLPGQTGATAPIIMGNWVVATTNSSPSNQSMSVIAISQANPNKIVRINPIPLEPAQNHFSSSQSVVQSQVSGDLPNNRIYAFDYIPGKMVAVNLNQATGNLSVAWGPVNERTVSFMTLIDQPAKRVLVATNINPNATNAQLKTGLTFTGITYTEQIVWRDAATGKILAQSDYFPAMSPGILVTPGYGGLIYELLYNGHIMAMQVLPKPTSSNSTSTTSAPGG
jgi:hypothetical protein